MINVGIIEEQVLEFVGLLGVNGGFTRIVGSWLLSADWQMMIVGVLWWQMR